MLPEINTCCRRPFWPMQTNHEPRLQTSQLGAGRFTTGKIRMLVRFFPFRGLIPEIVDSRRMEEGLRLI
jgi:hypothetical protein